MLHEFRHISVSQTWAICEHDSNFKITGYQMEPNRLKMACKGIERCKGHLYRSSWIEKGTSIVDFSLTPRFVSSLRAIRAANLSAKVIAKCQT